MVLTEHQLFHLDAILSEVDETRNLSVGDKDKWMSSKEIEKGKEEEYLDEIIKDVEKIKKSKNFPNLESPADIHDYMEKETKVSFMAVSLDG